MSLSTAASRATGFIRTWAMAVALGVTFGATGAIPIASSYNIANNIPNMVYELLVGGVLSAMFVPIFIERLQRDGREHAYRLANTLYSVTLVGLGLVALLGTVFPQPFVLTQTFTLPQDQAELAVYLFRFFAVQIIIYGWCAITTGVLNSQRRFFAPAIAPLVNNVVVIVTLLGFYVPLRASRPDLAIIALGVGTTAGVLTLLLMQVPALVRLGFRFRWSWDLADPSLRKLLRKTAPILGYAVVNAVAVSFRNAFAISAFPDGSAALSYAWNWYQLPFGVLAVAYTTAVFTELSEMANRSDWAVFMGTVSRGLRVMALLILPLAAMLVALSQPLVKLYRFGAFPDRAVPLVAGVLSVWALGLFSFAAYMFVLRAFYAQQDSFTPMVTNFFLTIVQVAMYWGLTSVESWGYWRLLGIPAADAVFFSLHLALLLVLLRRRHGRLDAGRVLSVFARVGAAAVAGGAVAWGVVWATPTLAASAFGFLGQLVAGGVLGLAVAYGLIAVMRVDEIGEALALARRGLGRIGRARASA